MTYLEDQTVTPPETNGIINWETGMMVIKAALGEGKIVNVQFKILAPGRGNHFITMWSIEDKLEIGHGWQDKFFFETYEHDKAEGLELFKQLVKPVDDIDGIVVDVRIEMLKQTFFAFFGNSIKREDFETSRMWNVEATAANTKERLASMFNIKEIFTGRPSSTFPSLNDACHQTFYRDAPECN